LRLTHACAFRQQAGQPRIVLIHQARSPETTDFRFGPPEHSAGGRICREHPPVRDRQQHRVQAVLEERAETFLANALHRLGDLLRLRNGAALTAGQGRGLLGLSQRNVECIEDFPLRLIQCARRLGSRSQLAKKSTESVKLLPHGMRHHPPPWFTCMGSSPNR
jgi:hypothetical protein